ncbi:MAG TPA: alpha/beta fold hydrolase [Abditibacteriaceae bacterium]|nr:alpha/beta fold hydrolase [Abditibacteriaceae bacterium]
MTSTPQTVSIRARDIAMPAQVFAPAPGAAHSPGLVMLHDIFGLDEWTQQAAARLAGLGYVTVAPDLYARSGGPQDTSSETALNDFTFSLHDSHLINDTLAALDWLAAREDVDPARLGVLGWGWGGAYTLMAAAHDARIITAVDIAGVITYPMLTAQKPGSPLNFVADIEGTIFAAFPGSDPLIPMNEIERLRGRLVEHDKRGEVKVYPDAPPRFWRDEALSQTARFWRRLENFLQTNLAAPEESQEPLGDYPNEQSRLHA